MMLLTTRANAKVTLFHHYFGPRFDGWWQLQSLFVPIGLWDEVAVRLHDPPHRGTTLSYEDSTSAIPPTEDLCLRAAALVLELAGETDVGVTVAVKKHIPVASGLGSGSADAAAVLRLVAARFNIDVAELMAEDLAVRLSFDVPAFMTSRPCTYSGDPRKPSPLAGVGAPWYALLGPQIPQFMKKTSDLMARLRVTSSTPSDARFSECVDAFIAGDVERIRERMVDLSDVLEDSGGLGVVQEAVANATGIRFAMTGTGPYLAAPVLPTEVPTLRKFVSTAGMSNVSFALVAPPEVTA